MLTTNNSWKRTFWRTVWVLVGAAAGLNRTAPKKKSYRNCELAHRRRPSCLFICRQMAPRAHASHCAPGAFRISRLLGDRYGRFSSHGHALQLVHRVHHERVYREISRALNKARRSFLEAPPVRTGPFSCSQSAHSNPAAPSREGAGSCGSISDPISLSTSSKGWSLESPHWHFRSSHRGPFVPRHSFARAGLRRGRQGKLQGKLHEKLEDKRVEMRWRTMSGEERVVRVERERHPGCAAFSPPCTIIRPTALPIRIAVRIRHVGRGHPGSSRRRPGPPGCGRLHVRPCRRSRVVVHHAPHGGFRGRRCG